MSAVASAHIALMVIAQKVSAKPEAGGLPGTPVLEKLINGMLFWGLLACVPASSSAARPGRSRRIPVTTTTPGAARWGSWRRPRARS